MKHLSYYNNFLIIFKEPAYFNYSQKGWSKIGMIILLGEDQGIDIAAYCGCQRMEFIQEFR